MLQANTIHTSFNIVVAFMQNVYAIIVYKVKNITTVVVIAKYNVISINDALKKHLINFFISFTIILLIILYYTCETCNKNNV